MSERAISRWPSLAALAALVCMGVEAFAPPALLPIEAATRFAPRAAVFLATASAIVGLMLFMARTIDRRAAAYAVAVVATTPLWFVPARLSAIAILPPAALAIVLAGAGIALLDERASPGMRAIAIGAAAIFAVAIGREALLAGSIALSATGAARLLFPTKIGPRLRVVAAVAFAAGVIGLVVSVLQSGIAKTTFDAAVGRAAYGLAPWSALVPFAIARRPRTPAHLALVIAAVLALVASTALPSSGILIGTAAIAGAMGTMLRDLDVEDRPSAALAAGIFAIGALVAHDVALAPDRLALAFASSVPLPEGHASSTAKSFRIAAWIVLVAALLALLLSRELLTIGRVRIARGLLVVTGGLVAGALLRVHAYPELAQRLSPGPAFNTWLARRSTGQPIAILGIDRRALTAIPTGELVPLSEALSAAHWLDEPNAGRRWLALTSAELPRVNAEWRARHHANVPVIAGRGGAVLLATSTLDGERSQNPLDAIVREAPPEDLRPVNATIGDAIAVLGFSQETNRVKIALRVLRAGALAGHCTFLHIDHVPVRFGAEHRTHAYPQNLWREGDVIVDDFEVKLPPHFRKGSYAAWFGAGVLPCQDDRRMPVTHGEHDAHDRVALGRFEVP